MLYFNQNITFILILGVCFTVFSNIHVKIFDRKTFNPSSAQHMKTNWNVTRKFQLTSSSGISGQSSKQGILPPSFIKSILKAQSFGFRFVHTNPFLTTKRLYILAFPKGQFG